MTDQTAFLPPDDLDELLAELARLGIRLWADGADLRFEAPAGVFSDALKRRVRIAKPFLLARLGTGAAVPLSANQARMWFLSRTAGRELYVEAAMLRLDGKLEREALESALDAVVARHAVLRTVFRDGPHGPEQVLGGARPALGEVDLSGLPGDRAEAALTRLLAEESRRPLDLETGPVIRFSLVRLAPLRHALVSAVHHAAWDGWSNGIFLAELAAFYNAALAGRHAELPPLPLTYADFAARQHAEIKSGNMLRRAFSWSRRLAGVPALLPLTTDRPRTPTWDPRPAAEPFVLGAEPAAALVEAGGRLRASLPMVLLAAYGVQLARVSGQRHMMVGMPVSARFGAELEAMIGYVSNTVPVRLDFTAVTTFAEAIERTRDGLLEAMEWQDVPLEILIEAMKPDRAANRSPLFQVLFTMQPRVLAPPQLEGLSATPFEPAPQPARYDLSLALAIGADGAVTGSLVYPTTLFDSARPAQMRNDMLAMLERSAESWGEPLALPDGPAAAPPVARAQFVPPATPTERRLADLWKDLLHVPRVGRDDDFFELGGHSLLLLRLVNRVSETGLGRPDLFAVMQATTLSAMAALIDGARPAEPSAPTPAPFPASPAQEAIWLARRDRPADAVYMIHVLIPLGNGHDPERVRRAVALMVERHESLRTVFREREGRLWQHTLAADPEFAIHDLSEAEEPGKALGAVASREGARPFDPQGKEPLIRFLLCRQGGRGDVLLCCVDHMVFDGASASILTAEIRTTLDALAQGRTPVLPPLPITPASWAEQRRRNLESERATVLKEFWRDRTSAEEPEKLPADAAEPADGPSARRRVLPLDDATMAALHRLSKRSRATPTAIWTAAVAALLGRYKTGGGPVVLGVPFSGRTDPESQGLIGCFATVLPVRLEVPRSATFDALARDAGRELIAVMAHQDCSPDYLLRRDSTQDRQVGPFDAVAVLESSAAASLIEYPDVDQGAGKFPLMFTFTGFGENRAVLTLEHDAVRYRPQRVQRMAEHLKNLILDADRRPNTPVAGLRLVSDAEAAQLEAFAGATSPYPRDASLAALFRAAATRHAERAALVAGGQILTYAELDRHSDILAAGLAAQGVIPGEVVGLSLERGPAAVTATLAVVKAGAAYLPLDPGLPPALAARLLGDAGARHLIVDAAAGHRLASLGLSLLDADSLTESAQGAGAPADDRGGGDPAYVMYTSGTTGDPKGVVVPHRAVSRLAVNADFLTLMPEDGMAQAAPFGFDAATLEIWAPLLAGARIVFIDDEAVLDPAGLERALVAGGVTVMWLTASLFNQVADERPQAFRSLRQLLTGGEALSPPHVRRVMDACPGLRLVNGYGPTENTTFTTTHVISRPEADGDALPIGRPIANTRVVVLDDGGEPVPIGIWGELCAAGDGLALGYADGQPGGFGAWNGERIYRTGDVVRWREDGILEFAGRRDGQVKIRGHRIETGAIEAALSRLDGVRDAAVLAVGQGDARALVGCVVCEAAREDAWLAALAETLPDFMIPARIIAIPRMPVSANGKKDRRALAELAATAAAPGNAHTPLRSDAERLVARLLGTLFEGAAIDAASDFLRLGGHSLLAMRLSGLVEKETGLRLAIGDIITARTVTAIARLIESAGTGSAGRLPKAPGPDFPLSSGQARLWVLQRLHPGSPAYNVPVVLDLAGTLDEAALERAVHALEERQHALRLRWTPAADDPVGVRQRLAEPGGLALDRSDVSAAADPSAEAEALTIADVARPFRLEAEAPARLRLITLGAGHWRLVIVIHHATCDGWSMPVLLRDLATLYARETGRPVEPLPDLARGYEDFAAWQRAFLEGTDGQALLERWRDRMLPTPEPLVLPADRRRPSVKRFRGAFQSFAFDRETSRRLEAVAAEAEATPFMVALALVQALLHRQTGQTDIALGTLVAGRGRAELADLVGFFVNTLVLRQRVDPASSFADLLRATRATCLEAIADQDCPFEALVDAVGVARDTGRNPLFDVLVAWQDSLPQPPELPGLAAVFAAPPFPYAKFDLGFHFHRDGDRIRAEVEYDTDLFDDETVAALLRRLDGMAAAALADCGRTVGALPALTAEEERSVVEGFNATAADLPVRRTIPEPFLDRAAAAGSAPAVLSAEATLSYAEFAARAAMVAQRLRKAGVGPGDMVALCARRSVDMLAGIHGILLAGAAYAPLDPDHPELRRADMLADLGEPLILTAPDFRGLFNGRRVVELGPGRRPAKIRNDARDPDGLAYVIFTSGSTGRPKGAAIPHHAVLNRVLWMQGQFPIGPGDVILQKTPITFDVSVWELFWWSWMGAGVALPPPGAEKNPVALVEAVECFSVTVMHFVPSMLAAFLACLENGLADPARLRSLRYVFASGEALDAPLVERFNRLLHARHGTELHNLYGPTEATVDVTWQPCSPWQGGDTVPIGRPVANTRIYILDREGRPVPPGVAGEIHIGGPQVALGYVNRPELTRERFIDDPFVPGGRLYRTGDLGRWRADGAIEYLGRLDFQVKVRGFRIECGEIELALETHPTVERAVVTPAEAGGLTELHAYVTGTSEVNSAALRAHLRERLPEYMLPARFFRLDHLPLTDSGKVNRRNLRGRPLDGTVAAEPATPTEARVMEIWRQLLPEAEIGLRDGFFDAGGNSLLVIRLHERLERQWPGVFTVADLFAHATVADQARRIAEAAGPIAAVTANAAAAGPVAIIGMAVRAAEFDDLDSFWRDLVGGVDRVKPLPPAREAEARALFALLGRSAPDHFREAAYLDDVFSFDPGRFRMAPMDAALLDPEQRLFLEVAILALEDAGYGGRALDGSKVGVFVGGAPTPLYREAMGRLFPARAEQVFALNVPSNVATRLSFLKDWRGPAAVVDTACSSGLAAIHMACRALAAGECEAALVGAAKVLPLPPDRDARVTIDSSTARTRAFAAGADGTGIGEGAAAFLLKPLGRALADGDPVRAVILGSALNQDGASSSLAAPNPIAQAEVVRAAAAAAGVGLGTLSYVEAHGTGTAIGDPIEVDGLTRAFAADTAETRFAALGSVKGNYGHLDGAAGALGLAKAVLCLAQDVAPPQPFFDDPNPKIDFARAPVAVPTAPLPLTDRGGPRRAGISSFGLSGINAHVIIEAPPPQSSPATEEPWCVIGLSAAGEDELRRYAAAIGAVLGQGRIRLADAARTLAEGRSNLRCRIAVCARDAAAAAAALAAFATDGGATESKAAGAPVPAAAATEEEARRSAAAYMAGADLSWPDLPARRVHLTPTPFARIPCRPDFLQPRQLGGGFLGPAVATRDGLALPLDVHDAGFWPAAEHVLDGRATLVGMALPGLLEEAARSAGLKGAIRLRGVRWLQPLRPDAVAAVTLELREDGGRWRAALGGARQGPDVEGWLTFAEAELEAADENLDRADLAALRGRCAEPLSLPAFSSDLVRTTKRWNCRRALWRSATGDEFLAELAAPEDGLPFHPALLDVTASLALDDVARVPAACETILLAAPIPSRAMAHVVRRSASYDALTADVTVFDPADGRICVALHGLLFATLRRTPTVSLSVPAWIPAPLPPPSSPPGIVVTGTGALAERFAAEFAAAGTLAGRCTSPAEISSLGAANILAVPDPAGFADTAEMVRGLLATARQELRVLLVGQGAYSVDDDGVDPDAALVAGLVLAAGQEEPLVKLRYLDFDETAPSSLLADEFGAFALGERLPIAMIRKGERFVPSLAPAPQGAVDAVWPASGCCVVTGGLGGIALSLAEELSAGGRVALALLGRSGRIDGDDDEACRRRESLAALERAGVRFRIWSCDVADRGALAACLESVRATMGPITAVVHASGVADGGVLIARQPADLAAVLAPKVTGARNLDLMTRDDPLQAFVLFGSLTGLIGAPGQTAYAAANAWLDAFAAWRRSQGRPALAIDWCAVRDVGMAARMAVPMAGAVAIDPAETATVWRCAISSGAPQVVVLDPAMMAAVPPPMEKKSPAAPPPARGNALEQALAAIWGEVLGYPSVAPEDDFFALGGDSISGMQIVDRVVRDLGHATTLSDLLEAGTVAALAGRLRGKGSPAAATAAPPLPDYPVSWEQLAVLNAEAAGEMGVAFNLPNLLELPPDLHVARLEAALTALVERHEILRTRFRRSGEEWRMEILDPTPVRVPVVELSAEGDSFAGCRDRIRPFDLERAPPVRMELIVLEGGRRALFLDLHHALADGWTVELLAGEIARLYAGETLPPLALHLKDFAWWSREGAGRALRDAARDYWRSRFDVPLPTIDLPADRRRPPVHSWRAGTETFSIPAKTAGALRAFASAHRATPFAVVLAAWMVLVSRLSDSEDVVISVAADRRDDGGFAGVAGMMASLLPIREKVRGDDTVGRLLDRIQAGHADALRHRAYGIGQLLEDLAPPAAPDRTLLSEISLSYMNFAEGGSGQARFPMYGLVRTAAKNDLSIFVRDLPDGIEVSLEYYADLFDRTRIKRLAQSFVTVLGGMVSATTDGLIAGLPLVAAGEAAVIAGFEAGASHALPTGRGLHGLFLDQAAAGPHAIAVEDACDALSYAALARRAAGIAQTLAEVGVRPGDRVALHVARDRHAVAAVLGIVAAGAAYVPLDPAWPAERVAMILEDASCRVVIADVPGREALGASSCPVVNAEALTEVAAETAPELEDDDQRPAYLMYTSGSTGAPKGVVIPQRAVIRLAIGDDYVRLGPDDRVLQAGPLAFDASTFEIWGPLLNGGRVCVAAREELLDPAGLSAAIGRFGITTMFLTASLFNRQVELDPTRFRPLRALVTGGETMSVAHMRRAFAACPEVAFFNGYGPTESTTFTTTHRVRPEDLEATAMPIGRPIPNTRVAVLDGAGQRAPIGVWGEIHAGGPGLAIGYWNRPELTAAAFVADPEHPDERLYRTGDVGRWREDGALEYGGRRDGQIKMRGHRIELDEIEQVLHRHPGAAQAAVVFLGGEEDGAIVACLEGPGSPSELRSWAARRLPAYMVPSRWYALDAIPLNTNGKVDRQRLASLLAGLAPLRDGGAEAPQGETEILVAAVLAEVLGLPVADRNADFLALGGHSLQAIRVVNRLAERTGVRVSMGDFFADSSVTGLARRLQEGGSTAPASIIPPAAPAEVYPASHAQQRLYLLHGMDRGSAAYNITFTFRCRGDLDADALAAALRALAQRHETLRTGFETVDGEIVQRIAPVADPPLAENDLRDHADAEEEALRIARREVATEFDLARPPLLRGRIVRLSKDDALVLLVLHHIVGDGWSSRILVHELDRLYAAARDGSKPDLAPLPIAYKDFAVWQRGRDWSADADFWRRRLEGAPDRISLPADRPLPEVQSYRGATCRAVLPAEVAAKLRVSARHRRVAMSAVGMGLFAALLYRLTRQSDMVLGMGVAGRDRLELEGLIGFFVNVLPVRLRLDDDTEIDDLIAQAQQAIIEAMEHRDYPFDVLVRDVAPRRQANRQPLVNVVFEYQKFGALQAGATESLPMRRSEGQDSLDRQLGTLIDSATAKHDLLFFFIDGDDGIEIMMEYDTDLLEAATAERWLAHFLSFAAAVASRDEVTP